MTEYKTIREWLKEGVVPIGYMDDEGQTIVKINFNTKTETVELSHHNGSGCHASIDTPVPVRVAPPEAGLVSDEKLLEMFSETNNSVLRDHLRSHILERMKAKGPTRGEVAMRLLDLLDLRDAEAGVFRSSAYGGAYEAFLSMFPEDDQ